MKYLKYLYFLPLVYLAVVVLFETSLILVQPEFEQTMRLNYVSPAGERVEKIVVQLNSGGNLYASANHWPRKWYRDVLLNPNVNIIIDSVEVPYVVTRVTDKEEYERVDTDHRHGLGFRLLTGFAPREIVRFDLVSGT